MKRTILKEMSDVILDRRLYGSAFFWLSGPLLAVGLAIEFIIYHILNPLMFLFYASLFIALILISGLASKNCVRTREISNMGHFRGFLFLIASVLAVPVPFLLRFSDNLSGFLLFLLTFAISTLALTIAIVEVTIFGQRVSLRDKIGLTNDFFKRRRTAWEGKLQSFPNSKKIIDGLENSKFVADLFDKGSFNLAVLWSCNVMEGIIDAVANGIIQEDPSKRPLFRNEKGGPQRYPLQLENLNYVHHQKAGRRKEQISVADLWDKIRNQIAHHNYRPTFDETYGALLILISFVEEFPKTLQAWRTT